MIWNVFIENFNRKQIDTYNIFDHSFFNSEVKGCYDKFKDNFEEFSNAVKHILMYYFWSKCEWEIILSDWPPSETFKSKKISVYDQVILNWDIFVDYVWRTLSSEN